MPENNSPMNDPLSGLLGALLGGHPAVQDHMQNSGQSLDQVLANLSQNAAPGGDSTGGSLADILGGMMSGAHQGGMPGQGGESDPLSAILGGLLRGASQGGMLTQGTGSDPLSAILGGLLGGGTQGSVPGAGAMGNNAFLAPIVDALAAKIGISPQIAETVASFALSQLLSGQNSQLAQMLRGGTVSQRYLRDSGLVNQLAQQTGMDNKTAAQSLQQVFQAFGTQMGAGTMDERQQGLQSWLGSK